MMSHVWDVKNNTNESIYKPETYEQLHGVKLKKNEVVIFLDGNRQNFSADNLHKLTRGALARYNQDRLYCEDKNISCAAAMIAELKDKTGELKRNGTQTHTKTQC